MNIEHSKIRNLIIQFIIIVIQKQKNLIKNYLNIELLFVIIGILKLLRLNIIKIEMLFIFVQLTAIFYRDL